MSWSGEETFRRETEGKNSITLLALGNVLFLKAAFLLQNESLTLEFSMRSTLRAITRAKGIAEHLAERAGAKRGEKGKQNPGKQRALPPCSLDIS